MAKKRMRWYNPKLGGFEWREEPTSDKEVLSLLEGHPSCEHLSGVYREWRDLGASIASAFIRTGEAAKKSDEGKTR